MVKTAIPSEPEFGSLSSLNLELLRLFVHVAMIGGIAPAARELNLSPSGATRMLARLEEVLGTKVFQRTTRSLRLTEAGAIALRWAEASLARYSEVADELHSLQNMPSGRLKLAMNHSPGLRYLPGLLTRFCEQHPSIDLSITLTDDALELLKKGADLVVHSGRTPDGDWVATRLIEFQRVLCASPRYLDRRGAPLSLEDLAKHDCLVHATNDGGNWSFRKGRKLVSQAVRARVQADSVEMLTALALNGLGIARLGHQVVSKDLSAGRLVRVLSDFRCVYPSGDLPGVWLVYPGRHVPYRTRALIDFISANWSIEEH
jgi:DNA-binding transcriptional LysR family regulator